MKRKLLVLWMVLSGALAQSLSLSTFGQEVKKNAPGNSRTFRFDYGATLKDLPAGARVRAWLPVPQSTDRQTVKALQQELPSAGQLHTDPVYGNRILYFELTRSASPSVAFTTSYLVRREEVRGLSSGGEQVDLTDRQRQLFLSANTLVPVTGKQLELLKGISFPQDPLAIARTLYDRVDDHVKYDKSRPGYGNGDVLWVCDSRTGNCTDFHSLFISWARAKGIPARFEIGFSLPSERGKGVISGYHCWAEFYNGQSWVPVDISEADKHPEMKQYFFGNLTENRVAFTIGRDINLVPRQSGEPLNYFLFPYVEVNGLPWPKEKIELSCAYADIEREK
ncbi:MAG: transglutaminase domain-containing protein [Planctomycetales bacterium]|nr:transglutaminase domain-containing protein [Planctomycetales bacterium]